MARLTIGGQLEVIREVDLDAVTLANRDGRQDVEEAIENPRTGLRDVRRRALAVRIERGRIQSSGALRLGEAGDRADREGHAEDLGVVMVDLILEPEVADL